MEQPCLVKICTKDMQIKNKTILITGAGGGIGLELATQLSKEGAFLILTDRNQEMLENVRKRLTKNQHLYFVCDMSKPLEVEKFAQAIKDEFMKLDFIFNIAGIGIYKNLKDLKLKEWLDSFNINVNAPFIIMKELIAKLDFDGGWIFNIGSGMGMMPTAGRSAYCASKFALRGLSLTLAEEYQNTNTAVTLITLGSVMDNFGTGGIEYRKQKEKEGKKYLSVKEVSQKIIDLIKSDIKLKEFVLYPDGYEE